MDIVNFFTVIFTLITWPVVVLISILIFRKPLNVFFTEMGEISTKWISFKRYGKFHIEGTEAIKTIYKKIAKTYSALESVVSPLQLAGEKPMEEIMIEKRQIFMDMANDFLEYFEENKIFFNQELIIDINKLNDGFREVWRRWSLSQVNGPSGGKNIEDWHMAWNQLKTDVYQVKLEIENKFRKKIGIE